MQSIAESLVDLVLQANPLLIYLLVAVLLLLESSGIPITNNTLLLLTGALTSLGHLHIWILICSAIMGSISGACLAYAIGQWGGERLLLRLTSFLRFDPQKVNMCERWFQKSGMWMIFFSRMTPYVRPFACFPAGISQMPFRRFFFAALSGSIIWCIALIHIGAALGPHWKQALRLMEKNTLPTIAVFVLLIALFVLGKFAIQRLLRSKTHSTSN